MASRVAAPRDEQVHMRHITVILFRSDRREIELKQVFNWPS
jgi:hypothetical protein